MTLALCSFLIFELTMNRLFNIRRSLVFVMGVFLASSVMAGTNTGTLLSSATLTSGCAVSVPPLPFGSLSSLTAQTAPPSSIVFYELTCTKGSVVTISADGGTTSGGTTSVRKMTDGLGHTIDYKFLQGSGVHATSLGNTPGVDTYSTNGIGSLVYYTVSGQIVAGQILLPGAYTDTITMTFAY